MKRSIDKISCWLRLWVGAAIFIAYPSAALKAQDILIKGDRTETAVKVVEIDDHRVKYKLFSHLDGPIHNIAKKDVVLVIYGNGKRELFNTSSDTHNGSAQQTVTERIHMQEKQTKAARTSLYVGATFANIQFVSNDDPGFDYISLPGGVLGTSIPFHLNDAMALNVDFRAALYRHKVMATFEAQFLSVWLELNPSFKYMTPFGLYAKAGPFVGYGTFAQQTQMGETYDLFELDGYKRLNGGASFQLGYQLNRVNFFLEYRKGLFNIEGKDTDTGQRSYLNTFSLGVGFVL